MVVFTIQGQIFKWNCFRMFQKCFNNFNFQYPQFIKQLAVFYREGENRILYSCTNPVKCVSLAFWSVLRGKWNFPRIIHNFLKNFREYLYEIATKIKSLPFRAGGVPVHEKKSLKISCYSTFNSYWAVLRPCSRLSEFFIGEDTQKGKV